MLEILQIARALPPQLASDLAACDWLRAFAKAGRSFSSVRGIDDAAVPIG
jgi:hypothetical protein